MLILHSAGERMIEKEERILTTIKSDLANYQDPENTLKKKKYWLRCLKYDADRLLMELLKQ